MKAKQTGFTLIELMFTIIVLAVLLGIGVPNFRDFVRNSRMAGAANDFVTDMNLARSEAVKRRVAVTLCKSANGTDCTTAAGSLNRWIVFVDDADGAADTADDGDGEVDTGEVVLRDRAVPTSITVTADGTVNVYQPSGFPDPVASDISRVLMCDERGSNISTGGITAARGITVAPTGRAAVTRDKTMIEADVGSGGFGGCPD